MAKYRDIYGNITEVGNAELNPELVAGKTLVSDTTPLSTSLSNTISVSNLTPQPPINYVNPNKDFFPLTAASADATLPEAKATPQETGISDLIKNITDIQNKNLGQTAFTAEQRTAQGIPELETAQTDIANQILMLQAQDKNVESEMLKQAEGRGITTGGLAPLTAERRRDLGIQANILSAQLAASQNKLALADRRVKLAVEAKFGPQEEELKAKLANLELLLKDPALSLADKNRANAQALILKQKEAEIAKNKQETTDIWSVSTTAAQNISGFKPTAQYTTSAQALGAIQNAKTKEEALRIAVETGLTKPLAGLPSIVEEYNYAKTPAGGNYKGSFTQYQADKAAAGREPEKNIFQKAQTTLQQYKDQGYTRQEVENEWKKQNAVSGQDPATVELPLTVQRSLDNLYGAISTPTPVKTKVWYNPLTWF